MKPRLSITIIALNEEHDLPRCLASAKFADEIIVADSGSTDRTTQIAAAAGAKVVTQPWKGYGQHKNFAMSHATGDWVFNIDADEVITPELKSEILNVISAPDSAAGYQVARKTFYLGKWIRFGGWYPNYVTRLARKSGAKWTEPNVHEELKVPGDLRKLSNPLEHYTFTDIADQIRTNQRYAMQGARDLKAKGAKGSIFKLLVKPVGKFIETYLIKLGMLDGLAGFIISVNAAYSVFMKYSFLLEMSGHEEKNTHH